MREIQASDAKARLPQLLDDVERGETLIITRHGRAIARIVPEVNRRQEEVDRSLANIRELRKRTLKVSLEEILSAKKEGHKD
jgi:prevent-host-death family protein